MSVAPRFTVATGRPRDALGDGDAGLVYLIERGAYGRAPLQTEVNLRIAASYRQLEITLDLFNLFDRRDATNVDAVYATGALRPIDGGKPEDLVFLRTDDGAAIQRRPAFQTGTAFQAPFAAILGLHRSF